MARPEPRTLTADELRVGLAYDFTREVVEADLEAFAANSGDFNPLHVDEAYARRSNYQARIAHGAFQIGLASAMAGMHLPGRHVLLGTIHATFPAPLYYPCRVQVKGVITAWIPANRSGQLRVSVVDAAKGVTTADIMLSFALHDEGRAVAAAPRQAAAAAPAGRRRVLVTGAAGGLGVALCASLLRTFDVVALVNTKPLPDDLARAPGLSVIQADLGQPGWAEAVEGALGSDPLYGVVHAAWPGVSRGGLLDADPQLVGLQLQFGSMAVIRLAKLLSARVGEGGGRFVAIGSIYGRLKPQLGLAAYTLGKAVLEDTVRLLAPELARRRVTINALAPAVIPVGMNKQVPELQLKREAALIPMGRLCRPDDVAGAVDYLMSDGAGFVSGQVLGLTGAVL